MPYVEEAFKLDVRAIMSAALKTGKKSQYSVTISCPTGYLISVDLHENADRVATASIKLARKCRRSSVGRDLSGVSRL